MVSGNLSQKSVLQPDPYRLCARLVDVIQDPVELLNFRQSTGLSLCGCLGDAGSIPFDIAAVGRVVVADLLFLAQGQQAGCVTLGWAPFVPLGYALLRCL